MSQLEQRTTLFLQTIFDKLAPLGSVTISPKRKPWVTPEILKAMKEHNLVYKKASQPHCPQQKKEHKRLRALVSNSLDTAKSIYLEGRLTKTQSSKERCHELRTVGMAKLKTPTARKHFSSGALNIYRKSYKSNHRQR